MKKSRIEVRGLITEELIELSKKAVPPSGYSGSIFKEGVYQGILIQQEKIQSLEKDRDDTMKAHEHLENAYKELYEIYAYGSKEHPDELAEVYKSITYRKLKNQKSNE